jgi:hypothetical protein
LKSLDSLPQFAADASLIEDARDKGRATWATAIETVNSARLP